MDHIYECFSCTFLFRSMKEHSRRVTRVVCLLLKSNSSKDTTTCTLSALQSKATACSHTLSDSRCVLCGGVVSHTYFASLVLQFPWGGFRSGRSSGVPCFSMVMTSEQLQCRLMRSYNPSMVVCAYCFFTWLNLCERSLHLKNGDWSNYLF